MIPFPINVYIFTATQIYSLVVNIIHVKILRQDMQEQFSKLYEQTTTKVIKSHLPDKIMPNNNARFMWSIYSIVK